MPKPYPPEVAAMSGQQDDISSDARPRTAARFVHGARGDPAASTLITKLVAPLPRDWR